MNLVFCGTSRYLSHTRESRPHGSLIRDERSAAAVVSLDAVPLGSPEPFGTNSPVPAGPPLVCRTGLRNHVCTSRSRWVSSMEWVVVIGFLSSRRARVTGVAQVVVCVWSSCICEDLKIEEEEEEDIVYACRKVFPQVEILKSSNRHVCENPHLQAGRFSLAVLPSVGQRRVRTVAGVSDDPPRMQPSQHLGRQFGVLGQLRRDDGFGVGLLSAVDEVL